MSTPENTDVIIVGGGPVGLTASLYLSHLGIRHVLVERHHGTSVHPRAIGLNQRTMELYRVLGVSGVITAQAAPLKCQERTAWYTSLDGPTPLHGRLLGSRNAWGRGIYEAEYTAASPSTWRILAQIRLEPLLRQLANEADLADIRFGSEVTDLTQDAEGVTVRGQGVDGPFELRGKYLIGADGGRTIGPILGIGETGPTNLVDMVTVHFSADLTRYLDPTVLIRWFVNPDLGGSVDTGLIYAVGPWNEAGHSEEYGFVFARAANEPTQFDEAAAVHRLKTTLGVENLQPVVHSVSHWFIQGVVADNFRSGRCFLAGDAAHRIPPWSAQGMNTGIQDIQNLCWKLAYSIRDPAVAGLLDSYEEERRPIAQAVADNALASFKDGVGLIDAALGLDPELPASQGWANIDALLNDGPDSSSRRRSMDDALKALDIEFAAHGADCGFSYTRGALEPADVNAPAVDVDPLVYTPRTLPGHHLPHFWLSDHAPETSTIDLPRLKDFVLIVDENEDAWRDALARVDHPIARTTEIITIPGKATSPDHDKSWGELREVDPSGAILVRPDAFVAWRWAKLPDDPSAALRNAFQVIDGERAGGRAISAGQVRA